MANQEKPLHTAAQQSKKTKQINNDVIEQNLMRVPASSLLRYQLMCKNWRAMIQEPWFKKAHFELNNTTNEPLQLLVLKKGVTSRVLREKSMVVDVNLQHHKFWMPRDLGSNGHFGGSSNGLLCTEVKGEITVFNPITQEVVSLPKPTYIMGYGSDEYEKTCTNLLFHSASGEYKVVLFYQNSCMPFYVVNMYTLGANSSWRQVCGISRLPSNGGVNVEDTIYWPYSLEGYDAIISFNLSKEKIKVIYPPMKDTKIVGLTKWHGKLCGVSFRREHPSINLWTLNNSVERACTLRHVIQLQGINGDIRLLAPYSIKMSRVFFATSKTIFYHDISDKRDDITVKCTCYEIKNCFAYVESLFPVPK